ncbi:hypothetical protein [Thalassobellus suaedae]|uniref:Alpha-N-arabinofuranosidase n=1 Tax=Thalassobellus suaedae TaxID=3074124 RepID=A0ABY9XTC4_9FLAO|nr:hypothetical protein RHP51_00115 [Flavobacteriaceae bacterium HL-DH14]
MKYSKTKLLIVFFVGIFSTYSQINKTEIAIKIDEKAPVISKHIYGHFAEHLGRSIYDGIYVGEDSNIPNTNGLRNDIIKALKDLKTPNLR